ncbi:MAG: hypothetical protein EOO10_19720 [Chitinophagaceae bacterium]|nr:MAG: hypothetical protein EOO10_19720 [Chitinophagaceae bacterium]
MENLFLLLATSLVFRISKPKFKRFLLGATGCSTYLVSGNNTVHFKHTKDGDRVYFYDQALNSVTFGFICVQMKEVFTVRQAENILVQYINRVRKPFQITVNIAMEIEKKGNIITISDYWQDENGFDWKVKGYTNGKTVAVLYVKNISNSMVEEHDRFLNGFKFSNIS